MLYFIALKWFVDSDAKFSDAVHCLVRHKMMDADGASLPFFLSKGQLPVLILMVVDTFCQRIAFCVVQGVAYRVAPGDDACLVALFNDKYYVSYANV